MQKLQEQEKNHIANRLIRPQRNLSELIFIRNQLNLARESLRSIRLLTSFGNLVYNS